MNSQLMCGLEIGNAKLCAVAARAKKDAFTIVGAETIPAFGITHGEVVDSTRLAQCIQELFQRLYFKTGKRIKRVWLSVNGDYFRARSSFATLALSDRLNRHITLSDINYLRQQARLLGTNSEEMIVHEYARDFLLDDQHPTLNPLGLVARKMQLHSYLLSSVSSPLQTMLSVVEQVGADVVQTFFSTVAASVSVLSRDERERGIIVVDIGVAATNLLLFKNDMVSGFKTIAFGGNALTQEIANALQISFALADDLKKTSLVVAMQEPPETDTIVIRREGSYQTIERRLLSLAVKPQLEHFAAGLHESIVTSTWKEQASCGVVGIGGTCHTEGILERIEAATGLSVRLGHVRRAYYNNAPLGLQYAAAFGALECDVHGSGAFGTCHYLDGKTPVERAKNFMRYLYYEYF